MVKLSNTSEHGVLTNNFHISSKEHTKHVLHLHARGKKNLVKTITRDSLKTHCAIGSNHGSGFHNLRQL